MIHGKSDSCQPDRVQRYKVPQTNTPVEALKSDYMKILGSDPISAAATSTLNEPVPLADQPPIPMECDANAVGNIIPTIPQYGVAIITNNSSTQDTDTSNGAHNTHVPDTTTDNDHPYKLLLTQDQAITDSAVVCNKDVVHTTPSRTNHINSNNDRFKVVKIATLEPFRRGRWKCMDYVDENPPISTAPVVMCKSSNNNLTQQQQFMQTQSLPQQHFQQMQQQFYQNLPTTAAQLQFFYPPQSTAQQQATTTTFLNTGGGGTQLPPGAAAGTTYYQQVIPNSSGGMTLVNYPGVQYVPANLVQTQTGSAFVPTSQNINTTTQLPSNLQQSQTYAGPSSSVSTGHQGQPQPPSQKQAPIVNGHAFPPITLAGEHQQSTTVAHQTVVSTTSALPTHAQVAKNVILATQQQLPLQPAGQYSINQQQATSTPTIFQPKTSTQASSITAAIQTPSSMQPPLSNQATNVITTVTSSNNNLISGSIDVASAVAAAANMYSNPQFVASVNKIVESAVSMIDAATANADGASTMQQGQHQHNVETQSDTGNGEQAGPSSASATGEDTTAKPNPVVNAIDNKIEQAMDLVKSHLMFTVREEVEVLKEKISELMERIQQLETENNMLRLQSPLQKQHVLIQQQQSQQTTTNLNLPTETSPTSGQQQLQQQQQHQQ